MTHQVKFNCNDPDGSFLGTAFMMIVGNLRLETNHFPPQSDFSIVGESGAGVIRIEGETFPFALEDRLIGNECFNTYAMDEADICNLINHLIASGNWSVQETTTVLFNKLERREKLSLLLVKAFVLDVPLFKIQEEEVLKKIRQKVESLRVEVYSGQSAEDTEKALCEIEEMLVVLINKELDITTP